jgi:hypothetical protein
MQEVVVEWGENLITLRLECGMFSKYYLVDQLTGRLLLMEYIEAYLGRIIGHKMI